MNSCYLCGKRKVKYVGCFVPGEDVDVHYADWLMGKLNKGKMRTFWYGLCEGCFNLPNKGELVEEQIKRNAKMKTGYRAEVKINDIKRR